MTYKVNQKRKSQRKFAEQFSGERAVLATAFKLYYYVVLVLAAIASFVMAPIGAMAQDAIRIPALGMGAAPGKSPSAGISAALLARLTRDQGPEFEQALTFTINSVQSTPTSIRTDRKIKTLLLHFRGRMTNPAGVPTFRTGPTLLGANNSNTLFSLIQQITIRGQHLKYGSQTVFQMRGEAAAEYYAILYPNWNPLINVSANGGALTRGGTMSTVGAQSNDIEFVLPIPLYPPGLNPNDIPFYCVHGPDWPGNLYVDVQCADGTALASVNPPTTFTSFGAGTGSPTINILTERPLLGKDLMAAIKPAITFRQTFTGQPTAAAIGTSGSGLKIADLVVGKDTSRIFIKTGTQSANQTAGVVSFGSLLDSVFTRTFISLDARQLGFQPANADAALQDYSGRMYQRVVPIGYRFARDFISTASNGDANPKAAFPSSLLTAARKFEVDADITAAANQIAEVTQEMILGTPSLNM